MAMPRPPLQAPLGVKKRGGTLPDEEIEAEIERRIREQSGNDSLAVLRGDRAWLIEKLDSNKACRESELSAHKENMKQEKYNSQAAKDANKAVNKNLWDTLKQAQQDLSSSSTRVAELEGNVVEANKGIEGLERRLDRSLELHETTRSDLATERRKVSFLSEKLRSSVFAIPSEWTDEEFNNWLTTEAEADDDKT